MAGLSPPARALSCCIWAFYNNKIDNILRSYNDAFIYSSLISIKQELERYQRSYIDKHILDIINEILIRVKHLIPEQKLNSYHKIINKLLESSYSVSHILSRLKQIETDAIKETDLDIDIILTRINDLKNEYQIKKKDEKNMKRN